MVCFFALGTMLQQSGMIIYCWMLIWKKDHHLGHSQYESKLNWGCVLKSSFIWFAFLLWELCCNSLAWLYTAECWYGKKIIILDIPCMKVSWIEAAFQRVASFGLLFCFGNYAANLNTDQFRWRTHNPLPRSVKKFGATWEEFYWVS